LQHYMPNMAEMVQKKHDDLTIVYRTGLFGIFVS